VSARIFRGNEMLPSISADDRGLNYGDGVFETILVHEGRLVWWPEHWHRLMLGAKLLEIPVPEESDVFGHALELAQGQQRAVLKLVLTRGSGGRGYLPPEESVPTVVLSMHTAPETVVAPIAVRWCETTLAIQPLLAGFKHLNRLEQVLARSEWRDPDIFEGLLRDAEGRVICATAANVFIRIDGRWLTPRVDRCGIAGIARGWLLANLDGADEADFGQAELLRSDAVFLCNAVRGILPVGRLGERHWQPDDEVARIRGWLADSEPAFAASKSHSQE